MSSRQSFKASKSIFIIWAVTVVIAGCVIFAGPLKLPPLISSLQPPSTKTVRSPQLVSVEPLPEEDGEMCQLVPVKATPELLAALQQSGFPVINKLQSSADASKAADPAKAKPVRMIRDPYAAYSAVAVDPDRNEVVLTDENLFNIMVYDRLANTPPTATMSEPKRMIGGLTTKIEFQCGLYIDPVSGDIYAVNNDTVDTLVIFSRQAKGNVPPDRQLHTPHGTFGIAVDEQAQEMYMTIQHRNAVVVYPKMAKGEDAALRFLQGEHTLLADPHGIAIDVKNNLMFVTNHGSFHQIRPPGADGSSEASSKSNWPAESPIPGSGKYLPPSITVYPLKATGDTAPLRVIQGPKTRMDWPTGIAVDAEHGELYIANDMDDSIIVFRASDSGDVEPIRVLKGAKTLVKNPTGVYFDAKNDEFWAANFGNHTATVYKRGASGDTPPLRVIRSGPLDQPALSIGNPHPVAYDSKREEILVPN